MRRVRLIESTLAYRVRRMRNGRGRYKKHRMDHKMRHIVLTISTSAIGCSAFDPIHKALT